MRRKFPAFLVATLLLAPTACSTGEAEPTPTVTAPGADPTSVDVQEPETTEAATESPEPAEPTETEPAASEPVETESEGASEEPAQEPGDDGTLSYTGLGEFALGHTDMVAREAMVLEPACGIHISAPAYVERGVFFQLDPVAEPDEAAPLVEITIRESEDGSDPVSTEAGAVPGMTYGEIRELYPKAAEETKDGDGGPFLTLTSVEGGNELVFLRGDYSTDALDDAQVVEAIALRPQSTEMRGSC